MKNLLALLITIPLLAACASMPDYIARLNSIRSEKLPALQTDLAANHLEPGAPMYIRIFKEEGILEVWVRNNENELYQPFRTYEICRLSGKLGPKQERGDLQSPEGFYDITQDRLWPGSQFHLAMNVGYPNAYDQQHNRTGDKLMIHGGCKSEGCFAMTDNGIEEIYLLTEQSLLGGNESVPVHIFPFKMTKANIDRYKNSPWLPFWAELKQGYDLFEQNRFPPNVVAQQGHYMFAPQVFVYAGAL